MGDWGAYKPLLTSLALPPVPFLVLILIGARLILPRRGLGYGLVLAGVVGAWACSCQSTAVWLLNHVIEPPPAVRGAEQARLTAAGRGFAQQQLRRGGAASAAGLVPPAAIIVLGGGRHAMTPEYGGSDLSAFSAERLRYGIWLGKQTGLPVGFSGGVGWGQQGAGTNSQTSEAETAARVAQQTFGVQLRWLEQNSADTRQNAAFTVAMLAEQRVPEVVVVTNAFHMPRAQKDFEQAARRIKQLHPDWRELKVTPAPMDFWTVSEAGQYWIPSIAGMMNVRLALKECLAKLIGA